MKRLIILMMMLCVLVSCQDTNVSGWIVGKKFVKEHTTTHHRPKGGNYTMHHPDEWWLFVADSTGVRKVNVTKREFDKVKKGQYKRYGNKKD